VLFLIFIIRYCADCEFMLNYTIVEVNMTGFDQELAALNKVNEAFLYLDKRQVKRIIQWMQDRFGIKDGTIYLDASETPVKVSIIKPGNKTEIPVDVSKSEIPEKKRRGRKPRSLTDGDIETRGLSSTPSGKIEKSKRLKKTPEKKTRKEIKDYDTVLDLLVESHVEKLSDKILLISAYLTERLGFKGITLYDISFRLKRLSHDTKNINAIFQQMLESNPPVLSLIPVEPGTKGNQKFLITAYGLKEADKFIHHE